jgi:Flp pilus assembly protein TadD
VRFYFRSISSPDTFGRGARKGNLDEAIAAIRKAIELDPKEALYFTELSRLYVQLGMVPEAEAAMAEAMRRQRGA